ncbi:molecular chaperone DjlA ['Osedax' symbiont bacterium Rs2_46_30_T18]|nr:molecular chaperone DjlA ['Osedax' symbiont bacterium Rs2_46_30_T18]
MNQQTVKNIGKFKTGLIIGALIGVWSGGVWGALFGAGIGFFIQRWLHSILFGEGSAQVLFFKSTFIVMGKVAKADGRVTEHEIQFARDVMTRMRLNEEKRREAMGYFSEGKEADYDLSKVLRPLSLLIQRRSAVKIMFLEIQLQAAMADGDISANELQVIQEVCTFLKMSQQEMNQLLARMQAQQSFHSSSAGPSSQSMIAEAYKVLGVAADVGDAELKKAYRRLMSQHHPDKLVAKGLPEEMMQLAKEKTQEIQAAYDVVKTSRK